MKPLDETPKMRDQGLPEGIWAGGLRRSWFGSISTEPFNGLNPSASRIRAASVNRRDDQEYAGQDCTSGRLPDTTSPTR